ncbi:unnamed protein product [Psylliodes chrysocephalus]|uniref:Uncharacterized protein n=1 Tax=Psylliodes chrysocephalus TaxID=3402493 RepID=A0A9P0CSX4_9CUCU|nr:unnamed protein product [Psylliodes chrysocephala]
MSEIDNNTTLKDILNEIINSKKELKNAIDASEARLLLKVESVQSKVTELQKENQLLKEEIEILKQQNKKNSIVIFGLQNIQDNLNIQYICSHIKSLLDIDIKPSEINEFYTLGKEKNSPLKVNFVCSWRKTEILKNCNKLKGKNISIVHEQTPKQRYESSILRKHLNLAKQDKQNNCYIKRNKLYVNENIYSVENLLGVEELANNLNKKPNSAPSTPTAVDPTLPENRNASSMFTTNYAMQCLPKFCNTLVTTVQICSLMHPIALVFNVSDLQNLLLLNHYLPELRVLSVTLTMLILSNVL